MLLEIQIQNLVELHNINLVELQIQSLVELHNTNVSGTRNKV